MYRYVLVQTSDNQYYDGIVESVDDNHLYLAVPVGGEMEREESNDERVFGGVGYGPGFGYPGYGYPGYGFPGYGYYRPRRRFQRLVLPLTALAALSLLPYY